MCHLSISLTDDKYRPRVLFLTWCGWQHYYCQRKIVTSVALSPCSHERLKCSTFAKWISTIHFAEFDWPTTILLSFRFILVLKTCSRTEAVTGVTMAQSSQRNKGINKMNVGRGGSEFIRQRSESELKRWHFQPNEPRKAVPASLWQHYTHLASPHLSCLQLWRIYLCLQFLRRFFCYEFITSQLHARKVGECAMSVVLNVDRVAPCSTIAQWLAGGVCRSRRNLESTINTTE